MRECLNFTCVGDNKWQGTNGPLMCCFSKLNRVPVDESLVDSKRRGISLLWSCAGGDERSRRGVAGLNGVVQRRPSWTRTCYVLHRVPPIAGTRQLRIALTFS